MHAGVDVRRNSPQFIPSALDLHIAHGLAFHDARGIQAARDGGCQRLCCEAVQIDSLPGKLVVANPFMSTDGSNS